MALFLAQLLTGLTHATVLFLIASGLTLIFGVTRVINFAHGSFYMLAAYLTLTGAELLPTGGASFYLGAVLASLVVAGLGGLVEIGLLRRIYRAPELYQLLLTFALVLIVGDAVRCFWGSENRTGPTPAGLASSVAILGQLVPTYDLAILLLGGGVAVGLWALLYRTRWGILIRAASQDRGMVDALGVNPRWLFTSVFVLGSWLAGLAGAAQAPRQALTTVMDTTIIVEAFVVVVIGGMGNVFGALLGSALIGVLQAFGILWLPREFQLAIVFLLMAVVLVVRPRGLLGESPAGVEIPGADGGTAARPATLPRPVLAGCMLLLLLLPPLLPVFLLWLLVEVVAFALFAASLQLLLGTGGLVSFGHAAYFGLGAYGAALLTTQGGVAMPVAFLLAPWLAALAAFCFGIFCVRARQIYFTMLTLAFAQLAYALVHQWYGLTGGDNGILGVWPATWLAAPLRYYYFALVVGTLGLLLLRRIAASPFGLALGAARDHAVRCAAIGVNVERHRLAAFTVAGFFAGVGGALFVFLKGSAFPEYLAIPLSVEALVMVLLGGIHSLAGAVVGAGTFKALDTLVTLLTAYWQAVLGGVLLVAVLAFPSGILGTLGGRRRGRGGTA